jgi:hypothetical protein
MLVIVKLIDHSTVCEIHPGGIIMQLGEIAYTESTGESGTSVQPEMDK